MGCGSPEATEGEVHFPTHKRGGGGKGRAALATPRLRETASTHGIKRAKPGARGLVGPQGDVQSAHLGCTSAAPRLHLGCISAASRLHLGCISALSPRRRAAGCRAGPANLAPPEARHRGTRRGPIVATGDRLNEVSPRFAARRRRARDEDRPLVLHRPLERQLQRHVLGLCRLREGKVRYTSPHSHEVVGQGPVRVGERCVCVCVCARAWVSGVCVCARG